MAFQSSESRNKQVPAFTDPVTGNTVLNSREPFRYRDRPDNIQHKVEEGNTWWSLAARYYFRISDRPAGLWWIVMGYQPEPSVDPTISLRPNTTVIVPHPTVVLTEVLGTEKATFQ